MDGYLTHLLFNDWHPDYPNVFRVSLLSYDKLYVGTQLEHFPWQLGRNVYGGETPNWDDFDYREYRMDPMALSIVRYFDGDEDSFSRASSFLADVTGKSKRISDFFSENFEHEPGHVSIFHGQLTESVLEIYRELGWDLEVEANRRWIYMAIQNLFVSYFLEQELGSDRVMTLGEHWLWKRIAELPPIPMVDPQTGLPPLFSKFCPGIETIQQLIPTTGESRSDIDVLIDIAVPDFTSIPTKEIVRIRALDKTATLGEFARDTRTRAGDSTDIDIAKAYAETLWKVASTLNPSVPETAAGVLGNVPMAPVNPVGIVVAGRDIAKQVTMRRSYPWFFTLNRFSSASNTSIDKPPN